ncbi:hypothetical protein E6W39_29320 [Kitasatospora acidiphila]|uniref:Uncharacterized protein n=1 Tax=Kitasatospora acidiphila TaxID=2567942 RepID=A0A540W992_9ACTN|nr:hypothetical protein [Kitasatospora acidiphila]TQF05585.1 hypothetical protein E6W39_29320 [Kitasatospora acidiphila]
MTHDTATLATLAELRQHQDELEQAVCEDTQKRAPLSTLRLVTKLRTAFGGSTSADAGGSPS